MANLRVNRNFSRWRCVVDTRSGKGKIKTVNANAIAVARKGPFSEDAVKDAAGEIRARLGRVSQAAFAFVSPDYEPHLDDFCEILRVDGHTLDVLGSVTVGRIAGGEENEGGSGFSVLAISADGASFPVFSFQSQPPDSPPDNADAWIVFADASAFQVENWLAEWSSGKAGRPVAGALSCSTPAGEFGPVFLNGRKASCVGFGVRPPLRLLTLVSQGCRPIGEPLTVTRAQDNVVFALGSRPAYEALESAFETLSDNEKQSARGNLFAGLAGTEYVDDFQSGDFLVRTILGADPNSGAVVIGGIPRVGQTLQYHYRNAAAADAQLQATFKNVVREWGHPVASLAFPCLGRGRGLFGESGHDARAIQAALGPHPTAGMFANGEIAPVGEKSSIHSYSLALALLMPSTT